MQEARLGRVTRLWTGPGHEPLLVPWRQTRMLVESQAPRQCAAVAQIGGAFGEDGRADSVSNRAGLGIWLRSANERCSTHRFPLPGDMRVRACALP